MTYQGHLSDGSSIQKHSAGGLYPYVIQFRGENLVPELLHPTGEVTQHASYDEACERALELLTLKTAARVCHYSQAGLIHLICSERTARTQSQVDFLRGISNLVDALGHRTARENLILA